MTLHLTTGIPSPDACLGGGRRHEDLMRPDPAVAGSAEVLVLKDRFGALGRVDPWFEPTLARFEDLAEA